ncbi:hypothetical protein GPL15_19455 [Clostridium sp. MCC353]|uniref:TraX family protein n=1 Tax=Clostridium sp. MCC353 TaxID=2592646 RepID=UPI001C0371CD|nr:TraX family protein [Clostridium sp. MCC353]MBT9778667.1 hypothetical protein [Clostridium sp. MCC353]
MKQEDAKTGLKRWNGINGNTLKMIAVITMVIDHIGAVMIEGGVLGYYNTGFLNSTLSRRQMELWMNLDFVCRTIGRIAFPIFCFLLAEGFIHTRDVKKYIGRMAVFALISEIPFDLAIFGTPFNFEYQNVYFTLVIGLLVLLGMSRHPDNGIAQALSFMGGCAAAVVLRVDYNVVGVLLITAFYLFHGKKGQRTIVCGGIAAYESSVCLGAGALSLAPIWFYNGERGKMKLKYLFYWFYPAHLMILYLARFLMGFFLK